MQSSMQSGNSWQEWVTVVGYITFLGFIAWRVLRTQRKDS